MQYTSSRAAKRLRQPRKQQSPSVDLSEWRLDDGASIFRASMLELALLIVLVLVLVFCIALLRRYAPVAKDTDESLT